ncbi:MAG: hypothetical protein V1928_01715 [Parcubacteria group bacterium]
MPQISSKYQKDFKNLDYKNPRIIRDQAKAKSRWIKLALLFVFVAIAGLAYLIWLSPVFQIKQVEISGLNKVKRESLDKIIDQYRFSRKWLAFSRNNFWIFNCNDVKNAIAEKYFFDDLKIEKKLLNRVEIGLKEKESTVNWFSKGQCFRLDPSGLAIEYCEDSGGLLKIRNMQNSDLSIGQRAINAGELAGIIAFNEQLSRLIKGKWTIAIYEKTANSLMAKTLEGAAIYFNSALPAAEQIGRLAALMNQSDIKSNLGKINYIDLRFGDKVYYK